MRNIGPTEVIIVLVIALLILGPKRLPAAGRSLGRAITEFKAGIGGSGSSAVKPTETEPQPRVSLEPDAPAARPPGA